MLEPHRHFYVKVCICEVTCLDCSIILTTCTNMQLFLVCICKGNAINMIIFPKSNGPFTQRFYLGFRDYLHFSLIRKLHTFNKFENMLWLFGMFLQNSRDLLGRTVTSI